MNITLANPNIGLAEVQTKLHAQFPNYEITTSKNFLGEYLNIKKSTLIGATVQKRKDNTLRVYGNIPTVWVRVMFGGLILIAFIYSKLKATESEIGGFLQQTVGRQG